MFGITDTTWMKKEILEFLDNEHRFISTRELNEHFPSISQSTLKKLCKELHDDIDSIYPNQEITLETSQRYGYQLHRNHTNLTAVYDRLFAQEIELIICAEALRERVFNTELFIQKHGISESQFRRKVKDLNEYLSAFDLRLTVAREVRIKGREITIRNFHFAFLYFCNKRIPSAAWLKHYKVYLPDVELLVKEHKFVTSYAQLHALSIWLYVNANASFKKCDVTYTEVEKGLIDSVASVPIPKLMEMLDEEDWKFVLLSIYVWDALDLNIEVDLEKAHEIIPPKNATYWIESFEKVVRPLNKDEKDYAYLRFFKHRVVNVLFKINDEMLNSLQLVDYEDVRTTNPYYMETFDALWEDYTSKADQFTESYFKVGAFLSFVYLLPFDEHRKKVKLYLFCELTTMSTHYQKERIRVNFKNRYDIEFVDDMRDADVLISSRKIEDYNVRNGQLYLEMNGILKRKELLRLEELLHVVKINSY